MFSKDSFPFLCDLFCFRMAGIPKLHFRSFLASCLLVVYEWDALVESESGKIQLALLWLLQAAHLAGHRPLDQGDFPPSLFYTLNFFLSLLASISAEKSSFGLITVLPVMCPFPLATFNIFSLCCRQLRHDVFRCSFLCIYPTLGSHIFLDTQV